MTIRLIVIGMLVAVVRLADAAPAIVHYFEAVIEPGVFGNTCDFPACEGVDKGSNVRGYFWLDSDAADLSDDNEFVGQYVSQGSEAGVSLYIEANNQWLHSSNAQYAISIFPGTTKPVVSIQTPEGTNTEGLDEILLAFCTEDPFYFTNDSLQTFDLVPSTCLGPSLVLKFNQSYFGRLTLVRPAPSIGEFSVRSDLRELFNVENDMVEFSATTEGRVVFEVLEDRMVTGVGSRGRTGMFEQDSVLEWSLEATDESGSPLSPGAPPLFRFEAAAANIFALDVDFDISMQDLGGDVRNVFLEQGNFYALTLRSTVNTWLGNAQVNADLPRITTDGRVRVLSGEILFEGASVSDGIIPGWLTTEPVGTDNDGDLVPSFYDSCSEVVNPNERDSDADGFGNACDADFNNDCIVNAVDLGVLRAFFFAPGDLLTDLNGDGLTNVVDLGIFRAAFFAPPGPSEIQDDCSVQ